MFKMMPLPRSSTGVGRPSFAMHAQSVIHRTHIGRVQINASLRPSHNASGPSAPASSAFSPTDSSFNGPPRPLGPTPLLPTDPASAAKPASWVCRTSAGGNDGGSGGTGGGGGGGSGGSGDGNDDEEFYDLQQAEELAAAKGVELPEDYGAAARDGGLRASVLQQYLSIATGGWLSGALARSVPAFRDRLVADRLYFFKILAEVTIDSACATVAEMRKRGEEFWSEFEFYLSDLLVGLVLDVVLVTLLAPVAVPGRRRKVIPSGLRGWSSRLPSAVFERSPPGARYSLSDRVGCYVARGLEYSLAGLACGVVGQGVASGMMELKRRHYGAKDDDVAVPPVLETGLVWGAFMALSANTRYQFVFGLERVVDETIARRVPQVAYLTTTLIRFANNIVGGEQFIDMARWAGIQ